MDSGVVEYVSSISNVSEECINPRSSDSRLSACTNALCLLPCTSLCTLSSSASFSFAVLLPIPFQIKTAVSLANPSPRIVVPSLNKTDLVSTKAVLSTQATVIPADRPRTTSPPPSAMSKMVSDDSSANPLPLPYRPYQSTEDTASPSTQANTDDGVSDKCANCAGPANHCCARCVDGVDLHGKKTPTFYCSTACKHIHWITHGIECGLSIDRGQLYKIGSLLQ
jgi:hypothetical protein